MIRHLLKLVWNRKGANALLILEMCVSFLVVFAVLVLGLYLLDNLRHPLGFDRHDVSAIAVSRGQSGYGEWTPQQITVFARMLREAQAQSRVVAAAGILNAPYDADTSRGGINRGDDMAMSLFNEVTPDAQRVLRIHVVSGRWFSKADAALAWRPAVINRRLARELFGSEDPLGQKVRHYKDKDIRVVGVIDDFRQHGELSQPSNYLFLLSRIDPPRDRPGRNILIRTQPGTTPLQRQRIVERLHAIEPSWSLELTTLDALRERDFRFRLAPLVIGGVIAAFLLVMVALGMFGVLWQSVSQRTRELGLRRAAGASRRAVALQVLLEILLISFVGVGAGTLLVVQLPILGVVSWLTPGIFAVALVLAASTIAVLDLACGLYPARLATRIEPAEALRYE